jgi:transmembrane sensor
MTGRDPEKTVESARRASPSWSAARQQQVSWAVMSRIEKARRRRPLIVMSFGGALAVAAWALVWQHRPHVALPLVTTPVAQLASGLSDGTRIVMDDATTVLRKTVEAEDDVLFELESGGARFDVARRPSRSFRVHAGDVTVQVIGTGFRMRRVQARCQVAVEHGRVLVSWWGGSRELGAGEQGTFPPEVAAAAVSAPAVAARTPVSAPAHVGKRAAVPAGAGEAAGSDALFARADRARAAGNPELAVSALRELRERFPRDPRAGAAAFTTGRLLLESLRRPREAAAAFAEARALARGDSMLAEDALAREVEALHAAGDRGAARARAELYRSLYPRGLRLQIVERFGELKADP